MDRPTLIFMLWPLASVDFKPKVKIKIETRKFKGELLKERKIEKSEGGIRPMCLESILYTCNIVKE